MFKKTFVLKQAHVSKAHGSRVGWTLSKETTSSHL